MTLLELVAKARVEVVAVPKFATVVELAAEIVSVAGLEVVVAVEREVVARAGLVVGTVRNSVSETVTPLKPPVIAVIVAVVVRGLLVVLTDWRIASLQLVQYYESEQELVAPQCLRFVVVRLIVHVD